MEISMHNLWSDSENFQLQMQKFNLQPQWDRFALIGCIIKAVFLSLELPEPCSAMLKTVCVHLGLVYENFKKRYSLPCNCRIRTSITLSRWVYLVDVTLLPFFPEIFYSGRIRKRLFSLVLSRKTGLKS